MFLVVGILCGLLLWLAPPAAGSPSAPAEITLTPADNGRTVEVRAGQVLALRLAANPSTGYVWSVEPLDDTILHQVEAPVFMSESGLPGAPGTITLHLAPVRPGSTHLSLAYQRPWEDAPPLRTFAVDVRATGPFDPGASTPASGLAGTAGDALLPLFAHDGPQVENLATTLPDSLNWCSRGGCTPVRDQGNCGSCWAFGTVGPLESLIKLNGGGDQDLAEQYLVSCNVEGYGCNGGWWAHDYHQWKVPPGEPGPGAVYEADKPYQAADVPCSPPHTHHQPIVRWRYVDPNQNWAVVPTVAALKQAIYDHGPLSVAICVGNAFAAYQGGVFSTNDRCYDSGGKLTVNHGVVLVGWDDAQGFWYLRNSWGPGWGEGGYMRIAYGTSLVGLGASYVEFGTVPHGPLAPTNLTAIAGTSSITLAWTDNSTDEAGFKIERAIYTPIDWQEIGAAGANVTSYADLGLPAGVRHYYRVRAYNGEGNSSYTDLASAFIPIISPYRTYLPLVTPGLGIAHP